MALYLLAFVAGALTLLAPCILPVLPFVFARADQPFVRGGLPVLAGMAATFAAVGSLAAVAGHWAVQANQAGRALALVVLAGLGLSLLMPRIASRLLQPVADLGHRFATRTGGLPQGVLASFLTGVATGFVWAPCAGPILGLILTGAAVQGPSVHTALLLLAYGAGAATSLAVALLAGRRLMDAVKPFFGRMDGARRALGAVVLAGVAVVALGLDTSLLAQLPGAGGPSLEEGLVNRLAPPAPPAAAQAPSLMPAQLKSRPALVLPVEGPMPELAGAVQWLNSKPLDAQALRGKVVLVDFWTFGCVNCRNALPYVRQWAARYKDQGLVVVGVHAPEFAFEKDIGNVMKAIADLGVNFPVAVDNNFAIWRAFDNQYWPAHYFIDARGNIRFHHFGEGEYEKSEQVIQQLLEEARRSQGAGT